MDRGVLQGISAYLLWGLFPFYFHALKRIPALEVVGHRVVWSVAVLALVLGLRRETGAFVRQARGGEVWGLHAATALLIAANWLLYVWGVQAGRVVECSLGYFLNPLVSVGLGVFVLRERLRPAQWVGILAAGAGVATLAFRGGGFPWLALALALSFGLYGLLQKRSPLPSLPGLAVETLVLLPLALGGLAWAFGAGHAHAAEATVSEWILLAGTGIATTGPLLLFSAAARRIPLSLLGLLQYATPTLQFLIGVWAFGEPTAGRLPGFALVWAGLLALTLEGTWRGLRARKGSP